MSSMSDEPAVALRRRGRELVEQKVGEREIAVVQGDERHRVLAEVREVAGAQRPGEGRSVCTHGRRERDGLRRVEEAVGHDAGAVGGVPAEARALVVDLPDDRAVEDVRLESVGAREARGTVRELPDVVVDPDDAARAAENVVQERRGDRLVERRAHVNRRGEIADIARCVARDRFRGPRAEVACEGDRADRVELTQPPVGPRRVVEHEGLCARGNPGAAHVERQDGGAAVAAPPPCGDGEKAFIGDADQPVEGAPR